MTELFVPDADTRKRLEEEHIKRVLSKSLVHRQSELDAENAKLRSRIAALEAALKPFADAADDVPPVTDAIGGGLCSVVMQRNHYFDARAALKGEK